MIVVPKEGAAANLPVWFAAGERITVLAMMFTPSGGLKFLAWSKKQTSVGMFPVAEFDIIDRSVPSGWVAKTGPNGQFELSPKDWQTTGFWERYHEDDPAAVQTFERWSEALSAGAATPSTRSC